MKRIIKIVFATLLLVVSAFALYLFGFYPAAWRSHNKQESIRTLLAAQTTNELALAVGSLGLFLVFPDRSWMAIRYRDTHNNGVICYAVVRDSGGGWHESPRHYCGQFMHYTNEAMRYVELNAEYKEMGSNEKYVMNPYYTEVHRLATSSDLLEARKNLISMGFTRMETPNHGGAANPRSPSAQGVGGR